MMPAFPTSDDSNEIESWRERSDFDGKTDCEKGVVGDVRPAEVLEAPLAVLVKTVDRTGGAELALLAGAGGLCMADKAM